MHFTEIPGQLVLTFNSISWSLIYKVLKFLCFGEYIIQLVKISNTNFKAESLQTGFLSNEISVEKYVDPVAPYLFLFCL